MKSNTKTAIAVIVIAALASFVGACAAYNHIKKMPIWTNLNRQ